MSDLYSFITYSLVLTYLSNAVFLAALIDHSFLIEGE